jgi:hypothetical protein
MDTDSIVSNVSSGHTGEGSKRSKKKRKMESTVSANAAIKVQPKKRAKGKGKAGKLAGLMLLPMDVLFEVRLQLPSCVGRQRLSKNVRYLDICDPLTYYTLHVPRSSSEVS